VNLNFSDDEDEYSAANEDMRDKAVSSESTHQSHAQTNINLFDDMPE